MVFPPKGQTDGLNNEILGLHAKSAVGNPWGAFPIIISGSAIHMRILPSEILDLHKYY